MSTADDGMWRFSAATERTSKTTMRRAAKVYSAPSGGSGAVVTAIVGAAKLILAWGVNARGVNARTVMS